MKKSDLARTLAAHNDITQKQAEEIVNIFFSEITEALAENEKVVIKGFGCFSVRAYGAYTGRNPRTGEMHEVKPKKLPFFKASRELLGRLNGNAERIGK